MHILAVIQCKYSLWYATPGDRGKWEEQGLPIGNGFAGMMHFGLVQEDILQYNDKTLWTGGPNAEPEYNFCNVDTAYVNMVIAREKLLNNKSLTADEIAKIKGNLLGFGTYQNFGQIRLKFLDDLSNYKNYKRELNIENAVHYTTFTDKSGFNHLRESFSSYPDNVQVYRMTTNNPAGISVVVSNEGVHGDGSSNEQTTVNQNIIQLRGQITPGYMFNNNDRNVGNNMTYESLVQVVTTGGTLETVEGNKIQVKNATEVILYLYTDTNYENKYPTYVGVDPNTSLYERAAN